MMLTRWNAFDFSPIRRSPLSLFGEWQGNLGRMLQDMDRDFSRFGLETPFSTERSGPRTALYDRGEHFLFVMEVPGVSEKDLKLSVNAESLTVEGERKLEQPEEHSTHLRERADFQFSRSFAFPCKVDVENVTANLRDGVLEVTVAKAPEAKPRQIEINID